MSDQVEEKQTVPKIHGLTDLAELSTLNLLSPRHSASVPNSPNTPRHRPRSRCASPLSNVRTFSPKLVNSRSDSPPTILQNTNRTLYENTTPRSGSSSASVTPRTQGLEDLYEENLKFRTMLYTFNLRLCDVEDGSGMVPPAFTPPDITNVDQMREAVYELYDYIGLMHAKYTTLIDIIRALK